MCSPECRWWATCVSRVWLCHGLQLMERTPLPVLLTTTSDWRVSVPVRPVVKVTVIKGTYLKNICPTFIHQTVLLMILLNDLYLTVLETSWRQMNYEWEEQTKIYVNRLCLISTLSGFYWYKIHINVIDFNYWLREDNKILSVLHLKVMFSYVTFNSGSRRNWLLVGDSTEPVT